MELKSHAKINLFLHIIGRRSDDYHYINSAMVFLEDLYDEISINSAKKNEVFFENYLVERNNTVSKALSLLEAEGMNNRYSIRIKKNIPLASGMAGGSGNAAAVLKYLAKKEGFSIDTQKHIAAKIGSDTVVCLADTASLVNGKKSTIIDIIAPNIYLVIINNCQKISTVEVYRKYHERTQVFSNEIKADIFYENSIEKISNLQNDLQPVALSIVPDIYDIINDIGNEQGCIFARMSGSGPTCFGVFYSAQKAQIATINLKNKYKEYLVLTSKIF